MHWRKLQHLPEWPQIEARARELCRAEGREPDADYRVGPTTMLSIADDQPQWWRQYAGRAWEDIQNSSAAAETINRIDGART